MALTLSAVWVPELRVLHVFQGLIYVALAVLVWCNSPWGYGVGVVIPAAWNGLNLFVTHLFQTGAQQIWDFIRTGHMSEPVPAMVAVGCLAHFVLIVACLAGILQLRPGRKEWGQFTGGGLLSLTYFAAMVLTVAPH